MGVGPVVFGIGAGVVVVRVFLLLFSMEEEVDEVVGGFCEVIRGLDAMADDNDAVLRELAW